MSDLSMCPFCGGPPELYTHWRPEGYVVECQGCGVTTPVYGSKKLVTEEWNKRKGAEAAERERDEALERAWQAERGLNKNEIISKQLEERVWELEEEQEKAFREGYREGITACNTVGVEQSIMDSDFHVEKWKKAGR